MGRARASLGEGSCDSHMLATYQLGAHTAVATVWCHRFGAPKDAQKKRGALFRHMLDTDSRQHGNTFRYGRRLSDRVEQDLLLGIPRPDMSTNFANGMSTLAEVCASVGATGRGRHGVSVAVRAFYFRLPARLAGLCGGSPRGLFCRHVVGGGVGPSLSQTPQALTDPAAAETTCVSETQSVCHPALVS